MQTSDTFVIAAWAAAIFGLAEGIVLCVSHAYPTILAPYKVSAHVLWIAPAVDLPLFLFAAVGVLILVRLGQKWLDFSALRTVYGFFVFLGVFTVITAPAIIHPVSAGVLSLGIAVAFCRKLRNSERRLTGYLRGRLVWIPVLIFMAGVGVSGYEKAREMWLFRQLPRASPHAVNVLVIVMDTVRRDSFAHPAGQSLTPNLDRIRAGGVQFENAWVTSSWSLASQASILTGRYPHEHGADWPHLRLNESYQTLGEFFARRGYVTGAFSGNAAWLTPEYLGRGFLRFDVYLFENLVRRTVLGRKISRLLWGVGYHTAGRGKKAPQVNAQFVKFLNDYRGRPFFAYLCYMDVNQAFHHRRLNRGFWEKVPSLQDVWDAYEVGLSELDTHIGDLFAELEHRDILQNTLVFITSDHGESFGAEDTNDHDPPGHGTSLYSEQIKVPLFVIYPGKLSAGQKVTRTVSTRAIPATITHLLNLEGSPFVGEALPILQDQEPELEDYDAPVLVTLNYGNRKIQSLIWDRWQYINTVSNPHQSEELYDLVTDPLAKKNLASAHPVLPQIRDFLQDILLTGSRFRRTKRD